MPPPLLGMICFQLARCCTNGARPPEARAAHLNKKVLVVLASRDTLERGFSPLVASRTNDAFQPDGFYSDGGSPRSPED